MLVIDSTKFKVGPGGTVTVYGAGFDELTSITLASQLVMPTDYSEEFICFSAPDKVGVYSFTVSDSESTSQALTLNVVAFEDLNTNRLPERSESSFRRMLDGLMPRGFAWEFEEGSYWSKMLAAIALAFAYLYEMLKSLVVDMSPYSTTNYGVWENELGLPRLGLEQETLEGRKSEIVRVARKNGGATLPYIKSLLNLYGIKSDVYEFWASPEVFPSWVADLGEDANFYVLVKIYRDSYYSKGFKCTSKCNSSLGTPRDSILETMLAQEKPAHVKIIYSYVVRILTDMSGNPIVNDNGQMIIV